MKTNKFDETLRAKLEGVQPEFSNQDWNSFQRHAKANTAGNFWNSYGRHLGYAAAASVFVALTAVCGLLYQQNVILSEEIQHLRRIVAEQEAGLKPDPEQSLEAISAIPEQRVPGSEPNAAQTLAGGTITAVDERPYRLQPVDARLNNTEPSKVEASALPTGATKIYPAAATAETEELAQTEQGIFTQSSDPVHGRLHFPALSDLEPGEPNLQQKAGWMPVRIALGASAGQPATTRNTAAKAPVAKPAKATKQEKALPTFVTSRPYRIGFAFEKNQNMSSYGVLSEFLVGNQVAITWGLTQTTYEALNFYNEKSFATHTGQNFRKAFGKGIPMMGEVVNISTYSSLFQMPIALSFRHPLPADFTFMLSAQTNLNLRFRQDLAYSIWDGHGYGGKEVSGLKYRKARFPIVNNVSPSLGVEKRFDPIVFQAEGYYYFRGRDIPYLNEADGFGARLKLLYQFGK